MSTMSVTPRPLAGPVYRLTRRGRLVVFAGGSMATSEPEATETVVVEPGQTLWEIAADASDGRDVRDMVGHLVDLNHLDSVVVDAGQSLAVPVG